MVPEPSDYWFPAKRFGWGWGLPITWQGWAVLGAYAAVVAGPLALAGVLAEPVVLALSLGGLVVATPVLVAVCLRKGEPPGRRMRR